MTADIYHYTVPLPDGVDEAVLPGIDGYTIYTADRIDHDGSLKAYNHALRHIRNRDFEKEESVNRIENTAHRVRAQSSRTRHENSIEIQARL